MKILLADDHELFNEGFALLLKQLFSDNVSISQANNWPTTIKMAQTTSFDLIMADLFMPAANPWDMELAELVSTTRTKVVCVLSSSLTQDNVYKALSAGAKGYIHKSSNLNEIHKALTLVLNNKTYLPSQLQDNESHPTIKGGTLKLTTQQQKILRLLAEGRENRNISDKLGIKESTVKRHVYNICQKFSVGNRSAAVHAARQHGMLQNG